MQTSEVKPVAVNKTLVMIVSSTICFFGSMLMSGINVALPAIGREFSANAVLLTWVTTVSMLTTGVLMVPFGRLADIIGIKKINIIGLAIFIPFLALTFFTTSIYMLLVLQFLQAVALAMVFATQTALIVAVYPPQERGKALGINVGILYFGMAIAPVIAGFLTEHFGWRSVFLMVLPGFIVALIAFLWKVKGEWVQCRGEKFDYTGAILLAVSLVAVMFGFSIMPQIVGWPLILAGIVVMYFFFKWESRRTDPLFDTTLFKSNRVFLFSNLTVFIAYASFTAVSYLMSLYLQYNKGFTAGEAGLVLVAQPVMQAIVSLFTGKFSEKVEPRKLASMGMGLVCLGLIPFAFLRGDTSMFLVIGGLLVLGAGYGLFSSPNTNAIMSSVSGKHIGVASAIFGTFRTGGQLFSMAITMVIISVVIGRVQITPENYSGFLTSVRIAFGFFILLSIISIFTSLARGKQTKVTN